MWPKAKGETGFMAKKSKRQGSEECALDMTPMIDVVFQLIIFFVVTLKTADAVNRDIELEYGKNGPVMKEENRSIPPLVIEVDKDGYVSIASVRMSLGQLEGILRNRVKAIGDNFPLLIRGDKRAAHDRIRDVIEVCTANGIWKISFVAMIEDKSSKRGK